MATQLKHDDTAQSGDAQAFEQLIAAARGGSHGALSEMIRSLRGYMLLVANEELATDVRTKVGASDLVQSALVLAEQNLDQFRGDTRETFVAWLRAILRNEINAAHRRYLQTEKRDIRREVATTTDSRNESPFADRHPSPRTEAIADEEAAALRSAMCRLPDDCRRVVMLRNWERLPFDEIGRKMDRSTGAVKKLWARAILRLKKELGDDPSRDDR